MSKYCEYCEYFNLFYDLKEPVSIRGTWGECVFPHKMNLDRERESLSKLIETGKIIPKRIKCKDTCSNYKDKCSYSSW